MTAELVDRVKREREERVRAVVGKLAHEVPELAELDSETLEKVARVVMLDEVKGKLKRAAELERIDYAAERKTFIQNHAGRNGSERTKDLYRRALDRLESWCAVKGISPLELAPAMADDWIADLRQQGRAPATVNVDVAAASSFWTWLVRRHDELRHPFRGTKARPARKAARKLAIPLDVEIRVMEAEADAELRAAIVMMSQGGLRVGALPSLSITGGRWTATTKGKEQDGKVPEEAREAIRRAGLPLRSPFSALTATKILDRFRYLTEKLHAAGKLRARYSVHDLRHAFALRLYQSTHDIYAVKTALGHANVNVTETYLRSLGTIDSLHQ